MWGIYYTIFEVAESISGGFKSIWASISVKILTLNEFLECFCHKSNTSYILNIFGAASLIHV